MTIRWPTKFKKAHLALTVSGVIPAQAGIQTNPHLCQCLHHRIAHLGGTDFSGARFVDIGRA
ncbi:MAG: hypothetical protein RL678_1070 [Pseudomonadota bacterium]|jgi:hypothetical protein